MINLGQVLIAIRLNRFSVPLLPGPQVWELKWKNGRRIYYAYLPESSIFILLGGVKNGQSKDITYAKRLFKKYLE